MTQERELIFATDTTDSTEEAAVFSSRQTRTAASFPADCILRLATINIAHFCFIIVRVLIKSLFYMTRPGAAGDGYQGGERGPQCAGKWRRVAAPQH